MTKIQTAYDQLVMSDLLKVQLLAIPQKRQDSRKLHIRRLHMQLAVIAAVMFALIFGGLWAVWPSQAEEKVPIVLPFEYKDQLMCISNVYAHPSPPEFIAQQAAFHREYLNADTLPVFRNPSYHSDEDIHGEDEEWKLPEAQRKKLYRESYAIWEQVRVLFELPDMEAREKIYAQGYSLEFAESDSAWDSEYSCLVGYGGFSVSFRKKELLDGMREMNTQEDMEHNARVLYTIYREQLYLLTGYTYDDFNKVEDDWYQDEDDVDEYRAQFFYISPDMDERLPLNQRLLQKLHDHLMITVWHVHNNSYYYELSFYNSLSDEKDRVADYPLIGYKKAVEQFRNGRFFFGNSTEKIPADQLRNAEVVYAEIEYFARSYLPYQIPFYKMLVDFGDRLELGTVKMNGVDSPLVVYDNNDGHTPEGMRNYVRVYVPAIPEEYIEGYEEVLRQKMRLR
ncbi:MAG: hypothetical protein FWE80_00845 [Oscillospiraceae bacterium]|nr:hypothetical protein [Oscillospiraceae bacterium]